MVLARAYGLMTGLDREFREALRLFVRSPAFVAAVVLPMALALGANTALFTVIRGVLLRPLPYADPERLVRIYRMSERAGPNVGGPLSPLNYVEDVAPARALQRRAAWVTSSASLGGEGAPEHVRIGYGTASLLPVLGLNTRLGRWFSSEEEAQGRHREIVLSNALWLRRFGGDPGALGKTLQLDGEPFVVVGVLPPGAELPELSDAWVPLSFQSSQLEPRARNFHFLNVIARLPAGATLDSVRREGTEAAKRTIADHPEAYANFSFYFGSVRMQDDVVRAVRPTLILMLGAVGLVLLIACFNVGNLMLARATARQRELAIRSALGAGRTALIRQLLVESLVLSVAAGILGVALAAVATPALLSLAPDGLPRAQSIHLDLGVLGFALAISLASGVLFGLVPAVSASDLDLEGTLRGSASMRPGSRWIRRVLVTADVGLALVLLCAASLLLRSFVHALGVDPGFRADGVTTFKVVVPSPSTAPPEASAERFRSHSERALVALRALPGLESAGAISILPLGGENSDRLFTLEGEIEGPNTEPKSEQYRVVTPGFFETLRIPLVQGRRIEASDGVGTPAVAVVNESFARRYFPGGDVLGKRIHLSSPASEWTAIVGVVGDVREFGLDEPVEPIMYFSQAQRPSDSLTYVVRSTLPFAQVSRTAAAAVEGVDAQVPTFGMAPFESRLSASVSQRRFSLALVTTFALLALVLAAVGLYGVVAYSVRQRTKEIGVRMAIGADAGRIARLVASESARMVGIGLFLGLAGALVVARLLASFLYGVGPADPLALAGAGLVLGVAAALATLFPVRRATRVDPVIALAAE